MKMNKLGKIGTAVLIGVFLSSASAALVKVTGINLNGSSKTISILKKDGGKLTAIGVNYNTKTDKTKNSQGGCGTSDCSACTIRCF